MDTIFHKYKRLLKRIIFFIHIVIIIGFSNKAIAEDLHIEVRQAKIPILKELAFNPVLRIKITNNNSVTLKSLSLITSGTTNLQDLKSIGAFMSGKDSAFIRSRPFNITENISKVIELKGKMKLDPGVNYIWISCELNSNADILHFVNINLEEIRLKGISDPKIQFDADQTPHRMGLALRSHGQGGVDTYRIPGLATSSKGTLMAVYDVRRGSGRDLQGDIDIGLSRSFDGGNSWEPMQIVLDMDNWGGLPQKFNGVSDASILVNGDDIYIAGLWMHGVINKEGEWVENLTEKSTDWNHQWRNKGSQAGFGVKETSQFLITKSTVDGKTWSEPVNLTKMCKKEDWWLWAPAPGRGIVMEDGTLVFPTQGRDREGLPFSNITYSKDSGKTWQTSNPASHNTTENSVVEYEQGKLMLNIRDNRNRIEKSAANGRAIFYTTDLGNTWEEHPTSHGALVEPVCMASLYKHVYNSGNSNNSVLLFSNPNSKYQRINQTIKMSFDGGKTWPVKNWILLDEGKGRGYSCLTSIDEHTIGIVYEGSRSDLIFQKIDISEYIK